MAGRPFRLTGMGVRILSQACRLSLQRWGTETLPRAPDWGGVGKLEAEGRHHQGQPGRCWEGEPLARSSRGWWRGVRPCLSRPPSRILPGSRLVSSSSFFLKQVLSGCFCRVLVNVKKLSRGGGGPVPVV